ncbi:YceI family protein [Quisquiliibacterium transsilvanicum]|uniref:Polyisoprenoid-binding protein YceI n=1 Tax=Quisquiliibacterium transsilvanicum TaxID=1549638 RepID=A0A7W8HER8_9BURK|nr:YceI family protein [Quisquiliibacterium transsilvanicum]MBB5270616.1 polyisoprenoid-binding protein YceI [Quisquiliibacterium transsilvanicum]
MTHRAVNAAFAAAATLLAAGAVSSAPGRYVLDPMHTFVNFEVLHFGTSTVRARFDRTEGHVLIDPVARTGEAVIRIDTASVSSGIPDFDQHLKSPDFLDVGRARQAVFVGNQFTFDGERVRSVAGTLTMLGKAVPVTLEAQRFNCYDNPMLKARICGGDFETTIRRSQWGMNWGIDMGVPDAVRLLIQIEAVRQ